MAVRKRLPRCRSEQAALKAWKKTMNETAGAATPVDEKALPPDALIIVPVRQTVLFPGMVLPIAIGRPRSIAAVQCAARNERPLGILLQKDPSVDDPAPEQLYMVGTSVELLRY